MLTIHGLSHTYPDGTRALSDVSLEAGAGIFGLLGPNGAGKSTLMRAVATLLRPSAGSIRFGDVDALAEPHRVRERLGYLPQEFGLYPTLGVEETLDHFAALKGARERVERRERVHSLLARVNLLDARRRRVGTLSGGMRQRLGLAIALAGDPTLLVLDEPTAGLDPEERHRLYDLLATVGGDVVVVLSTHIVEDVRELCRSLAIIDRGRVVLRGDPDALVAELRGRVWRRRLEEAAATALDARHRVISRRRSAGSPVVRLLADDRPDAASEPAEPTLEDVYFLRVGEAGGPGEG